MGEISGLLGLGLGFFSVLASFTLVIYAIWLKSKSREMRHRERLAMIEKGMVPPEGGDLSYRRSHSNRQSGVFLICLGIGLALMMGLTSGRWQHVWIGAILALIGVANLVNSLWDERDSRRQGSTAPQTTQSPDR